MQIGQEFFEKHAQMVFDQYVQRYNQEKDVIWSQQVKSDFSNTDFDGVSFKIQRVAAPFSVRSEDENSLTFAYKFRAESTQRDNGQPIMQFEDTVTSKIEIRTRQIGQKGVQGPEIVMSLQPNLSGQDLQCRSGDKLCKVKELVKKDFVSKWITFETGNFFDQVSSARFLMGLLRNFNTMATS